MSHISYICSYITKNICFIPLNVTYEYHVLTMGQGCRLLLTSNTNYETPPKNTNSFTDFK